MLSEYGKFKLLFWKNWKIQLKRKKVLVIELILPVLLGCILSIFRNTYTFEVLHESVVYDEFEIKCDDSFFIMRTPEIVYSPSNNTALKELMENVHVRLNKTKYDGNYTYTAVNDSKALEQYLLEHRVFLGVEFEDKLKGLKELPKDLKYSIRIHNEIFDPWNTEYIIRKSIEREPRNGDENEGTVYASESFLCIQNIIDRAFIEITSKKSVPEVRLKRFPEKEYTEDLAFWRLSVIIPILFTLNYAFVMNNIIREVAKEREYSLKRYLYTVGFSKTTQWLAWFAKTLSFNLIGITIWTIFFTHSTEKGIFTNSNPFLIWIYLLFFITNLIWFSFFLSMFFSKGKISAIAGMILWVFNFLPYIFIFNETEYFDEIDFNSNFIWSLLPSSGMALGFFSILALESHEGGLHFHNLFLRLHEDGLSVGLILLASILSTLIVVVLIANTEVVYPDKEKRKNWYYLLQYTWKKYFDRRPVYPRQNEEFCENDSIIVSNLTKIFKRSKKVIDDVSFKIPKNQITVLLGHSGSGKSTIMSILRKEFSPTSGEVNFYDTVYPSRLGFTSKNCNLFTEFTVLDQLVFTCKFRGLTDGQAFAESRKYLEILNLISFRNIELNRLSSETLYKIELLNALCGNPKLVLLDEPTKGLDLESKDRIWNLLREEKQTKTIVIATKDALETEAVSDQIILLNNGKVQASGSLSQIKEKFGIGYRFECTKDYGCQSESITVCLKLFVPDIQVDEETDTSVVYILNESLLPKYSEILQVLESESGNFGITHIKLHLMALGDILNRYETFPFRGYDSNGHFAENNGEAFADTEDHLLIDNLEHSKETTLNSGFQLLLVQIYAVILKRLYFLRSHYRSYLFFILVPILATILLGQVALNDNDSDSDTVEEVTVFPELKISLANYSKTNVYIKSDESSVANKYQDLLKNSQKVFNLPYTANMDEVVLEKGTNYVIGANFSASKVTAWYNNEYFHSSPLTLNMINQAILKTHSGEDYSITVSNKPYYETEIFRFRLNIFVYIMAMEMVLIAFIIGLSFISFNSSINVKERTSGVKLLQFNYGFNRISYWLISLFLDGFVYSIFIFFMLGLLFLSGIAPRSFSSIFRLIWSPLLFSWHMLSLIYLLSTMFRKAFNMKIFLIFFNTLPAFLFAYLFAIILMFSSSRIVTIPLFFIQAIPTVNIGDYISESFPIIPLIYVFIFMGILMLIEYKNVILVFLFKNRSTPKFFYTDEMDTEVINEIDKVSSIAIHQTVEYGIVFQYLSNLCYGNDKLTLLSLTVNKSSCVGLICQNSNIRSSIFKMISGEERMNTGDIFINGKSLKNESVTAFKGLGYCSKDCNLFRHMTGRENLKVFGLIKGIPKTVLEEKIKKLSEELNFVEYLDKMVKGYSEMNRKLLGLMIAMIGDPQVIVLEEPISELDETTTKAFIKLLNNLKTDGKTILILSNNLLPYESICNKTAIVSEGVMKFLNTPDNFKKNYSEGINLTVELQEQKSNNVKHSKTVEIKSFVQGSFMDSKIRFENSNSLTFNIPVKHLNLSEVFRILEELKTFDITRYSVTENSLEYFMNTLNN